MITEQAARALDDILRADKNTLLDVWCEEVKSAWGEDKWSLVNVASFKRQSGFVLEGIMDLFSKSHQSQAEVLQYFNQDNSLSAVVTEISGIRAQQGFSTADTTLYFLKFKEVALARLRASQNLSLDAVVDVVLLLGKLIDNLVLQCIDAYIESRERLIRQQGIALLELSTPVVKLWDRVLLLPLVGVIDTNRARKITDSLLTEINKQEASVTVIDLTGVPIFDTAVAGHLMKTVQASQMLGCGIILTGISPEGALVLTKLGIRFDNVLTRGTLRQGVSEALKKIGKSVAEL